MKSALLAFALTLAACGDGDKSESVVCRPPQCTSAAASYAVEVVGSAMSAVPQTELTNVTIDNTTGIIAVSLGANVQVTGNVTSGGVPVSANVIFTRPSLIPGRPNVYYETTADPAQGGLYSVSLPPSSSYTAYTMRVRPTDTTSYPPYTTTISLGDSMNLDVELPSGDQLLRFSGALANAVSIGVGQAKVVLRDAKTLDDLSTTSTTDMNGKFSVLLGNAAAGGADGIVLVAQQGDVSTGQLTLTVPIDASQVVQTAADVMQLALPALPATTHLSIPVVGMTSSGTTQPVVGATFQVVTTITDTGSSQVLTHEIDGQTDASGKINVDLYGGNGTARTYQVTIVPAVGSGVQTPTSPLSISVGTSSGVTQQLMLAAQPLVTGRVLDSAGSVLKGASVQPQFSTVTSLTTLQNVATATTDSSGRFGLNLDPGTYDIGVTPATTMKLPRAWSSRQAVSSNADVGDIRIADAVMFEIVLRDSNQNPAQATVRLFVVPATDPDCNSNDMRLCYAAPQLEAEVATGSDGSATMLLPAQAAADMGSVD